MSLPSQLRVVLHQVRSPENLGAVARLIANFEIAELVLSDPKTWALREAEKVAVRAMPVLETLRMFPGLDPAVSECVFAIGTTSRAPKGRRVLGPEEGVALLAEASARGKVALVFGGEKRGLSDEELARCQEVVAIPTGAAQPSMNLAQAAAVMLYLCAREGQGRAPASVAAGRPLPRVEPSLDQASRAQPGAKLETVAALEQRMREVLLGAGFLNRQAPDHILRELVRTLTRGALTQREAELWLTAFRQLGRATAKD